jgi:hypothetical protein
MGKRVYVKNSTGKRYISVTTVLGIIAKPALYKWYADRGWEGARKELKDAGDGGTAMHTLIDRFLRDDACTLDDARELITWLSGEEREIKAQKVYAAFSKVCEWARSGRIQFKSFLSEYQVSDDEWGVMGCLDNLSLVAGRLALVDWKGGKGIWPEMILQVSAYLEMLLRKLRLGAKDPVDEKLIALLDKQNWQVDRWIVNSSVMTGEFQAKFHPWFGSPEAPHEAHAQCVRAFENCIDIYNWQRSTPSALRELTSIKIAQEEL